MNTYRISYTRRDPVYGKGWVVLYHASVSAKRTVKATTKDEAAEKLVKAVAKVRPESTVEINVGGIYQIEV